MRSTMMDLLFVGVGWTDLAITLNRVAVGAFFMLSGYHKLFNAERHRSVVDELKALGVPAVGFNQWWVPLVEFTAGGAVLIGLLAPLAGLGLFVIILVAIATSGRQRIKLYKPIDESDRIDDWLYLPETLYAFMLLIRTNYLPSPFLVRVKNVILALHDRMARETAIDGASRIRCERVGRRLIVKHRIGPSLCVREPLAVLFDKKNVLQGVRHVYCKW
jgi:uncharacterized membrane protein YphA (DoxX/SURF4 family)